MPLKFRLHQRQELESVFLLASLHCRDVAFHIVVQREQLGCPQAVRCPSANQFLGNVLVQDIRQFNVTPNRLPRALFRLMHLEPVRGNVPHSRHRQRTVRSLPARNLCVSRSKARQGVPNSLLVVRVMASVDRAIQPLGDHSVDSLNCLSRQTGYTLRLSAPFVRFCRDEDGPSWRRRLPSPAPLLPSSFVKAGDPFLHASNILVMSEVLGLPRTLIHLIMQSEVGTNRLVQPPSRSMAIAVVRQGFAPRVGSSLDPVFPVVPSRGQPLHN